MSIPQKIGIPSDIRTVYSHSGLDPEIIRILCCPKCFKQYPTGGVLLKCTWKRSPRSRPCGADLYIQRQTLDGSKQVAKCLFTTQSFESWLTFLLSRSQIDQGLQQTFAKSQNPHNAGRMHDIHDSPIWNTFRGFLQSRYHLVFAMYIDWFNPFTNKIAGKCSYPECLSGTHEPLGKVVSCGAIILYCLNLPLSIRFLSENTFIVGMTPAPHAPNVWTISHVLHCVQRMIIEFDLPGKVLPTHQHPGGTTVAARLIPLIADLQAIRKVAGFLSHGAGLFCSFCKCRKNDVENLDSSMWEMRRGAEVRTQAQQWRDLITVKLKTLWLQKLVFGGHLCMTFLIGTQFGMCF